MSASGGSTPDALTDGATGRNIFYNGADGRIWQWSVQNNQWNDFMLYGTGGIVPADGLTSPGSVVDSGTGRNVFYFNNGRIWQWSVQNGQWNDFNL